jgi:hypothetical protein
MPSPTAAQHSNARSLMSSRRRRISSIQEASLPSRKVRREMLRAMWAGTQPSCH